MNISLFLVAFAFALLFSPFFQALASKLRFYDNPTRDSKIHKKSIPYLGGMVVFSSFLLSLAFFNITIPYFFLVAFVSSLFLGTIDDLLDIRALYRLPLQLLIALVILFTPWRFSFIPVPSLNIILVVLFILGIINALNCWDVTDGALGLSFLAISLSLLYYSSVRGICILYLIPITGAIVGWLPYNIHPAKMFLGDGGAYFLGVFASAFAIYLSANLPPVEGFFPLFPFILPCLDFIVIHCKRYNRGIKNLKELITSTGKDHFPHRILAKTRSPNLTALSLFFLILAASSLPLFFPTYLVCIPFVLVCGIYFLLDRFLPPSL